MCGILQEFECIKEIVQMSDELLSWKVLLPSVFTTSALLLLLQLPSMSIILSAMKETITGTLGFLWVTSMALLLYKVLNTVIAKLMGKRERTAQERTEREAIENKLEQISECERRILEKVKSGAGCGVWLARDDAVVQTLIHKGFLERIGEVETWQDWEAGYDGRALCILMEIPVRVKSLI